MSEVTLGTFEHPVETPPRIGLDRSHGDAFTTQSGCGERDEQTLGRRLTGSEVVQASIHQLGTGK